MASNQDGKLRDLAKSHGISFTPPVPSHEWPSAHRNTFDNIKKLGEQSFDGYCASIDIHSSEQPWRERTKYRADWLAKRAGRLITQRRNEAGWRLGVENDVFHRFRVEVACPKCRERIWRSEIEACIDESDDMADQLEVRRRSRMPCQCPPENRPQDYYEIGTNAIFDDRAQEAIIHDSLAGPNPLRQEPDRVFGLQLTRNFDKLLSAPVLNTRGLGDRPSIREAIRSSPFQDRSNPLLFPFLIVEAKSEKSSSGFDDIQAQTALPIWTLLKLQDDLCAKATDMESEIRPLVWFFAYRGDSWRVYGCYTTCDEPKRYNIVQLWDGCILDRNDALQLLLIVDYIFDWARDVYRPTILKQLKSLGTGGGYDQVSMASDTDTLSMRQLVSKWVQAAPSIVDGLDNNDLLISPNTTLDHQSLLKMPLPNTKRGTLRSALLSNSRVVGLYITEHNVMNLLQVPAGQKESHENSQRAAREILNFLTQRDDILLLSEEDLHNLEEKWTGNVNFTNEAEPSSRPTTFYVLIEYSTFINNSWDIVRETTYLAIAKAAFEVLVKYADFRKTHEGIQSMSQKARPCSYYILCETINCLRSGSPSQVLLAAISCTFLSINSLPKPMRADHTPLTATLGFEYIKGSRLRDIVSKYHKYGQKRPARKKRALFQNSDGSVTSMVLPFRDIEGDETLVRIFERKENITQKEPHLPALCDRCFRDTLQANHKDHWMPHIGAIFSDYGMVLVESLDLKISRSHRHDVCLFFQETPQQVSDDIAISVIAEDLLQSENIYHTIRHPVPPNFARSNNSNSHEFLWNLPFPYRPPTAKQDHDISDWIRELRGQIVTSIEVDNVWDRNREDQWNSLQVLLFCLNEGETWESAKQTLRAIQLGRKDRAHLYRRKSLNEHRKARGLGPLETLI